MSKAILHKDDLHNAKNILTHVFFDGLGKGGKVLKEVMKSKSYTEDKNIEFKITANGVELDAVAFFKHVEEHIENVEKITDDQIENKAKELIDDKMEEIKYILEK